MRLSGDYVQGVVVKKLRQGPHNDACIQKYFIDPLYSHKKKCGLNKEFMLEGASTVKYTPPIPFISLRESDSKLYSNFEFCGGKNYKHLKNTLTKPRNLC